uniref:Chromosome 4 open reading frame 19 n=1 Tax=Chelonoidis abingdonii TaxID=106734 RepID=A0A8C0JE73_CHEAB
MGCRCCKMIQSYFFDPDDVQSSRYPNEVNSYKPDKQDSNKFKGDQNSETPVHKNELQNDELKRTENKNKLNSTKEAFWNHRGTALDKEGLGNCVENQSAKPECSIDENSPSAGENSSLTESAILETQNDAIQLPDLDYLSRGSQTRNYHAPEKDSFSDNYTHSDQNAEYIVINKGEGPSLSLPLHMKENYDSVEEALKTESVNVCVKEDMPDSIASEGLITEAREEKHINHKEINGKIEEEEEDAEVAEALAALEAATAGEDYEEDEEY